MGSRATRVDDRTSSYGSSSARPTSGLPRWKRARGRLQLRHYLTTRKPSLSREGTPADCRASKAAPRFAGPGCQHENGTGRAARVGPARQRNAGGRCKLKRDSKKIAELEAERAAASSRAAARSPSQPVRPANPCVHLSQGIAGRRWPPTQPVHRKCRRLQASWRVSPPSSPSSASRRMRLVHPTHGNATRSKRARRWFPSGLMRRPPT